MAVPSWLVEVPLAHRGLHGDGVPENSEAAFRAAAAAGYGVELDVTLARDGTPVVVHDPVLTRVAGVDRKVADLTLAELSAVRLFGTGERLPTLPQALAALGDAPVMVEVKNLGLRAGRLERAVADALDGHDGPWCVAGFNPATGRWFRKHRPDVVRVLTATATLDPRLPAPLRRRLAELADLDRVAPHAVSYELGGLPSPATDRWRDHGGPLVTWTVRSDDDLARARELADNVIFEHVRP